MDVNRQQQLSFSSFFRFFTWVIVSVFAYVKKGVSCASRYPSY